MKNPNRYTQWAIRKWKILSITIAALLVALFLIYSRSGFSIALETLLLTVATALLVGLVFELIGKDEFINLLDERLRVQDSFQQLGIEKAYLTGQEAHAEIQEMLKSAEALDFVALSGGNSYANLEQDFKAALARGCHIRVLLCDELSDFVKDSEAQEGPDRVGQISKEIDISLRGVFHKLAKDLVNSRGTKGLIEVRTHKYAIYSNIVIAKGQQDSLVRVLHVPYMTPTTARFATAFVYFASEKSGQHLRKFSEGFNSLWEHARLRLRHDFKTQKHECDIGIETCGLRNLV